MEYGNGDGDGDGGNGLVWFGRVVGRIDWRRCGRLRASFSHSHMIRSRRDGMDRDR